MSIWQERLNKRNQFFEDMEQTRKSLLLAIEEDDNEYVRELSEAQQVFDYTQQVFNSIASLFEEHATLESVFEKKYGPVKDLYDPDALQDICFIDEYIYPETQTLQISIDEELNTENYSSELESLSHWVDDAKTDHENTQLLLKDHFDIHLNTKSFKCHCIGCIADYRANLRDTILKMQLDTIDEAVEELHDKILYQSIDRISDYVSKITKKIEKNYHLVRTRLRKGSLNKLNNEVKSHFARAFDSNSELAKVYKEKLIAYFNSVLTEADLKTDLIEPAEYARFFEQLHTNIWKPTQYLRREFEKLVSSVLTFKRKDISATILKDYLGQFWLHSEARRMKRKFIYHMGPTNSGKTYHAIERLCSVGSGSYLAPLRLLASELYDTMNTKGAKTTLLTGEEVIEVEDATHFSSTIEMARLHDHFDCVVIDEIQMITDSQRGWAWTRALVNMLSPEIHLCGDPSVLELVKEILVLTGDELEVREYTRMTELQVEPNAITLSKLKKNDALIVFSRRNALKYKSDLERLDFKVSIVYGRLSPEVRREQARKFDEGETDIMVSTDAIAMGMNLPVRRIVFSALSKFFDSKEFPLSFSEIKQIAGRAGRFGRFPVGSVTTLERVQDGVETLEFALESTLEQSDKCMVGPDLEIFSKVNDALLDNGLPILSLAEFLRLFNTMSFTKPFYCVDLKEMIELAEMVEELDVHDSLSSSEKFGFACAPVNLGLMDHVQYFSQIVSKFSAAQVIENLEVDDLSDNIDYLETAIKCVELFQWLARHFNGKHFVFDEQQLLINKTAAIEKLNNLLSERLHKNCSSCGVKMSPDFKFNICEKCFDERKFSSRRRFPKGGSRSASSSRSSKGGSGSSSGKSRRGGPSKGGSSRGGPKRGKHSGGPRGRK